MARIQITVDDLVISRIDLIAEKYGLSRSGAISWAVSKAAEELQGKEERE